MRRRSTASKESEMAPSRLTLESVTYDLADAFAVNEYYQPRGPGRHPEKDGGEYA
jgi:hypothetical protein